MADIFGVVEKAIISRLSDPSYGFNASYVAIVAGNTAYSTLPGVTFDFSKTQTLNFNTGIVPWTNLIDSSDFTWPYMMMEVTDGSNDTGSRQLKFQEYSGTVNANLQIGLSFKKEAISDFSSYGNAIVVAMETTFNAPSAPNQWGTGVIYNGGFRAQKGTTYPGGDNWLRVISFNANFYLVA